tara:strand:- start:1450 stop:2160 length:711 start_codon:yes stop_codon:yes gene_type:complete
LKNNNYTFWIISDNDSFRKSFNLSETFIKVIVAIFIVIFMFSIYGFLRVIGKDRLTNEINELKKINNFSIDVVKALGNDSLIHKYPSEKELIDNYFKNLDEVKSMIPPVSGYVTQGLDLKSNFTHTGIDIAAKKGEKILSPADGLVVFSGITDDLGKTIIISHSNNLFSLYGHNDKNTVNPRTIVNKGDVIGYVGETGNTDGPHLHFELWKNSEVLDPRDYINIYKKKDISTDETR